MRDNYELTFISFILYRTERNLKTKTRKKRSYKIKYKSEREKGKKGRKKRKERGVKRAYARVSYYLYSHAFDNESECVRESESEREGVE